MPTTTHLGLDLYGTRVRVRSSVAAATRALRDRLAPFLREPLEGAELALDLVPARAHHRAAAARVAPQLRWERSRPLWGQCDATTLALTDGASLARIDYGAGRARLAIAASTAREPALFARTFLLLPLLELLRTRGLFFVHGALVTRGRESVLLLGRGGGGKSTLAAALLRCGWRLVADDNLLLRLERGRPRLWPLEQELSLAPTVLRQLGLATGNADPTTKQRLPLDRLPPSLRASHAVAPRRVLVLAPAAGDVGLRPLARSAVLTLLLEENPMLWAQPALAAAHLGALRALLQLARCWRYAAPRLTPLDLEQLGRRCHADLSLEENAGRAIEVKLG